jgi:glutamate-1-semialdehyde 2,1-aminomutase
LTWDFLGTDQELLERELARFLPQRIFDCHAHLCQRSQFGGVIDCPVATGPDPMDWNEYRKRIAQILPNREMSGLFFGYPKIDLDVRAANDFTVHEVAHDQGSRALMLVHPGMDLEFIRETVKQKGFVGLKCYHIWSREQPTFNSTIPGFLPEEQVRIAHEMNLVIMLHIVRPRALADAANCEVLRLYSQRYPGARFILAHAARGFNPYHTIEGIGSLRGLHNIWFDTSAVTESGALEAILRSVGVTRLLYGSDFPISHIRGRCVAIGDSFLWLNSENTNFTSTRGDITPTLVGIESLRALKLACMNLDLSQADIEAIFHGNAVELLNLGHRPS